MQYRLLLMDAVTFFQVRRRSLLGAFCLGVATGMLMFWTPLAASSTRPADLEQQVSRIDFERKPTSTVSSASLEELEQQEALLMQAWLAKADSIDSSELD